MLLIVLLLSQISYSQSDSAEIKITASIDQGFRFQNLNSPLIYINSVSLRPVYRFDGELIQVGTTFQFVYYDTETELYSGPRVTFRALNTKLKTLGEPVSLLISGEALYGTSGRKLFGGGLQLNIDPMVIMANAYQEYTSKEFWFMGGIGLSIDQYLLPK